MREGILYDLLGRFNTMTNARCHGLAIHAALSCRLKTHAVLRALL